MLLTRGTVSNEDTCVKLGRCSFSSSLKCIIPCLFRRFSNFARVRVNISNYVTKHSNILVVIFFNGTFVDCRWRMRWRDRTIDKHGVTCICYVNWQKSRASLNRRASLEIHHASSFIFAFIRVLVHRQNIM